MELNQTSEQISRLQYINKDLLGYMELQLHDNVTRPPAAQHSALCVSHISVLHTFCLVLVLGGHFCRFVSSGLNSYKSSLMISTEEFYCLCFILILDAYTGKNKKIYSSFVEVAVTLDSSRGSNV